MKYILVTIVFSFVIFFFKYQSPQIKEVGKTFAQDSLAILEDKIKQTKQTIDSLRAFAKFEKPLRLWDDPNSPRKDEYFFFGLR